MVIRTHNNVLIPISAINGILIREDSNAKLKWSIVASLNESSCFTCLCRYPTEEEARGVFEALFEAIDNGCNTFVFTKHRNVLN